MVNILKNSRLGNWKHDSYFFDKEGRTGTIELPEAWSWVFTPKESDPNKNAESLHRDDGFLISAAYRAWEAGYAQKGVQLKANQRYLAKAVFKPDVNFPVGQPERTDAVTWQFRISSATETIEQGWQMTGKGHYKQQEENLFVFHSNAEQTVDYAFLARSAYAGNDCDLTIYQLSLEEVAATYGGTNVPTLGNIRAVETISTAPEAPEMPVAKPITTTEAEKEAEKEAALTTFNIATTKGPSGKALGDVLDAADIDQIAAGLRALASANNATIANGLNKLAEALERLK